MLKELPTFYNASNSDVCYLCYPGKGMNKIYNSVLLSGKGPSQESTGLAGTAWLGTDDGRLPPTPEVLG